MEMRTVLVLGGTGFIGRHAVAALQAQGHRVIVATRHPHRNAMHGRECREVHMERSLQPEDWQAALRGCDAVVNCVGILRPRGRETYDRVHHRGPAALAAACAERGIRLVHVSALGLSNPVRSGFLRSKRDGEEALRASRADCHIVRPSLLDGSGGFGARWLRRVARWPIHPYSTSARGRIAALDVRDLGVALANLACGCAPVTREHDLGGSQSWNLRDYLAALRAEQGLPAAMAVPVPGWIVRVAAHVCDALHLTPLSFGHWELLRFDNCPEVNALPALLGRPPRSIGARERGPELLPERPLTA